MGGGSCKCLTTSTTQASLLSGGSSLKPYGLPEPAEKPFSITCRIMINASDLRASLQQQIQTIHEEGWTIDAQCLQGDLDRSGDSLPELLITRDCVEAMLESIAADSSL